MTRLGWVVVGAALAYSAPQPVKATVIWNFQETGITCPLGECFLPTQPYTLLSLTLPALESSGSATWQGFPGPAPVYTGDAFTLTTKFGTLDSHFIGGSDCGTAGQRFCRFNISWSAIAEGIHMDLDVRGLDNNIGPGFNADGGFIASDGPGFNGGCVNSSCFVTGHTIDPIDEPLSLPASLLAIAALFISRLLPTGKTPA